MSSHSMENMDRKFDKMLSLQVLDKSKAVAHILQEVWVCPLPLRACRSTRAPIPCHSLWLFSAGGDPESSVPGPAAAERRCARLHPQPGLCGTAGDGWGGGANLSLVSVSYSWYWYSRDILMFPDSLRANSIRSHGLQDSLVYLFLKWGKFLKQFLCILRDN